MITAIRSHPHDYTPYWREAIARIARDLRQAVGEGVALELLAEQAAKEKGEAPSDLAVRGASNGCDHKGEQHG